MTHEELPYAILDEYPDLTRNDLKQTCAGVYYRYTTEKYGVVGGHDFGLYLVKKDTRTKHYFDNAEGI